MLGAQTQFYTYTDGYAGAHGNRAGSTLPLGAVVYFYKLTTDGFTETKKMLLLK